VLLGIGSLLMLAAIARLLYERLLGAAEELPTEEMPILLATQEIERQSDRRLLSEPVGLTVRVIYFARSLWGYRVISTNFVDHD
jgi:hypothetical protein